jgi:hypothetical protein
MTDCDNQIQKNRRLNYLYKQIATSRLSTNQRFAPRNDDHYSLRLQFATLENNLRLQFVTSEVLAIV